MLGLLISEKELQEVQYLLKREMEEILFDLEDDRIKFIVKRSMIERYKILLLLFKRISPSEEWSAYSLKKLTINENN